MKLDQLRRACRPLPSVSSEVSSEVSSDGPGSLSETSKLFRRFRDRTNCSSVERCGGCDGCLSAQALHAGYDPATETKGDLYQRLSDAGIEVTGVPTKAQMVEALRLALDWEI